MKFSIDIYFRYKQVAFSYLNDDIILIALGQYHDLATQEVQYLPSLKGKMNIELWVEEIVIVWIE